MKTLIAVWVAYCEHAAMKAACRVNNHHRCDRKEQQLWQKHEQRYERLKKARAWGKSLNY